MKTKILLQILLSFALLTPSMIHGENRRVIITTDLGGTDPDDEQSMVHLLMMSNNIDIEGMICQMAFMKSPIGIGTLTKIIDAYEKVYPNLIIHDNRYPTAKYLRSIATTGQTEVGMSGVGKDHDTPGSDLIIKVVDKDDDRPIWLTAWGGMNTIAQAIWKVKNSRSEDEFNKFISKIRIYDILGQCDAGAWIAKNFPEILYIRSTGVYGWAPSDEFLADNIQKHGAMGAVYPKRRWATEGDSPSFLYLVDNGLNLPEVIDAGGWGGRFDTKKAVSLRGMDWVKRNNLDESKYDPYEMHTNTKEGSAAISLWKEDIENDFAARIQWSVSESYTKANHHPLISIGKVKKPSTSPIIKRVKAGATVNFDASKSYDPDKDSLSYQWIFYKEVSSYKNDIAFSDQGKAKCSITIPIEAAGSRIYVILKVKDNGTPSLSSYRRIIIDVTTK